MTFRFLKILCVFLLTLSLSGCSMLTEYRESEQVILISGIGFDKKDGVLSISAETVYKEDENESVIIVASGNTAEECIKSLKVKAGIPIILSHCGSVVISEELSKTETKDILLYLCTLYEFPLSSRVMSSGNALSLLKGKSISSEQNGYVLAKILKENNIDSRLFVQMRSGNISLPAFSVDDQNYVLKDSLWTPK